MRWTYSSKKAQKKPCRYAMAFKFTDVVLLFAVTLVKTVNTSAGLDMLLFSCIKRVAFLTDFNTVRIALFGRARFKACAASTGYRYLVIIGMNIGFHYVLHLLQYTCLTIV